MATFLILECSNPGCRMRFPVPERALIQTCPRCASPLRPVDLPFASARVQSGADVPAGPQVEILLDNLRSAFNVGSILRAADGAGIRHAHLCGITPTDKLATHRPPAGLPMPMLEPWRRAPEPWRGRATSWVASP